MSFDFDDDDAHFLLLGRPGIILGNPVLLDELS